MPDLADPFPPHMPAVDPIPDPPAFFAQMRAQVANPAPAAALEPGQRCVGIVTPGRLLMFLPAPRPGRMAPELVAQAGRLLPSEKPLHITVVACTPIDALTGDNLRRIPQLGQLLALAYLGHNLIVFEGHPSAFEAALQNADALLIDSGMLPFLQPDWASVAFRAMPTGARILVQDRKTGALSPVLPAANQQGWRYGEPDGEMSYLNCLLTTLANRPVLSVEVVEGRPVPDLAPLAIDPGEREWVAELPFRYDRLSAKTVIALALKLGKWARAEDGSTGATLRTKLAAGGQLHAVSFRLRLAGDSEGVYHLSIEKSD